MLRIIVSCLWIGRFKGLQVKPLLQNSHSSKLVKVLNEEASETHSNVEKILIKAVSYG